MADNNLDTLSINSASPGPSPLLSSSNGDETRLMPMHLKRLSESRAERADLLSNDDEDEDEETESERDANEPEVEYSTLDQLEYYWHSGIQTLRDEFFSREGLKKFFKANRWAMLAILIFLGAFLALGLTVWRKSFKDPGSAWAAIAIVFSTFVGLIRGGNPEILMMLNTCVLVLGNIIDEKGALEGFANSSIFTIIVLFVVASGIEHTGSLDYASRIMMGKTTNIYLAQIRMMVPTAIISAFINNTPQVAIQIPMTEQWCRRMHVSPSKMMIPLSWATILGGTLSLLGTSPNLLVQGLLLAKDRTLVLPLMEIGAVGAPLCVVGIAYIVIVGRWLLPERINAFADLIKTPRDYAISAKVEPKSAIIGQTVEAAKLRGLENLYLLEIKRADGSVHSAVSPDLEIMANDTLSFVGKVDQVKEVWQIPGLVPTNHLEHKLKPRPDRAIIESVVPQGSSLVGKTARRLNFREKYSAGIIAIHRSGEHLRGKIGAIRLETGDCLLMEARGGYMERENIDRKELLVLNEVQYTGKPKQKKYNMIKLIWAPIVVSLMIIINALGYSNLLGLSLGASFVLMATGCMTAQQAYRSIDVRLYVIIAGSFGMATALDKTGVAKVVSDSLISVFSGSGGAQGAIGQLFALYMCTMLLTALLSNNAAVAIMFPIAYNMTNISLKSRMYIIMYAASCDFSTPFGYQTNIMVYAPGGYKFLDYTKFGLPLQLLLLATSCPLVYAIYG
eukprot:TRINITY_DN1526_c0_g1_i3.p1 TRINITY_DN1526_c0_g1~~TRINITY_DN1526_c0_g1_i3.p1  ORF type:complete len:733 (+),score=182.86 TRINITY_DN1526_c0_g1_i3:114-2312(+)